MFHSKIRTKFAVCASVLALTACAPASEGPGDIVEVASANGSFSTLVAAVAAADLVDTLQSDGPFTVFAPTDDAFAALPSGTVENLLLPENKDQLVDVLTYHVVPGKIMAADLPSGQADIATVQGSTARIDTRDGAKIDGANIVATDVAASNGVIHVIDAVILP
ncbi:MAG: fasciclin domain-containing protein [Pseudomonadota bacterium]